MNAEGSESNQPHSQTPSPSLPASPAIPVRDLSTRLSAIQTVQTYILTHEAQAIQSHLTAVLPGLIQGEVRTQYAQLAQEIGAQISSIREEVIRSTGDQDDPMSSSNEGDQDSREHGKRSSGRSHDKRKGKTWRFATGSGNEVEETRRQHHRSHQPNNGDEADEEDEGDENESDEGRSAGRRKYKKQIQALRVSTHSCSP